MSDIQKSITSMVTTYLKKSMQQKTKRPLILIIALTFINCGRIDNSKGKGVKKQYI